jgi:putative transposase
VKYAFIDAHRKQYGIRTMCRVLNVARSGFYAWVHKPFSDRAKNDKRLLVLIKASYGASGGIYGSPRVHRDLKEVGERVSVKRVARIMKQNHLRAIRGYKKPRQSPGKPASVAPNRLNQQFSVTRPDEAWVTDITYIRTWQGWLYLAVVLDLHLRMVIGWSMKPTLARDIVLDALLMAVWKRKPRQKVIIHSDQGSQYSSDDWQRFCRTNKLLPSMSRRGNCYDNAVAESFFSSLKKERIRKKIYRTRDDARADLFHYIEVFYNRKRRHSHIGGVSPEAFETAYRQAG